MKIPKTLASLGYRDYRLLWISSALANSGQYAFTIAASWLIFSISKSSALVGVAMFATMIPGVLFGPIIGVLVDRVHRRKLLTVAVFLNAMNLGTLTILSIAGLVTPWVIIACAFLLGICFNVQMTCTNAMMPSLIPKEILFNGTALQGTISHGAGFLGSAIASPILVLFGPYAVFGLCFLLYVAAGTQSLWVHFSQTITSTDRLNIKNVFKPILEGFVYIKGTPLLGLMILMVFFHCFLTMAYTSLLPEFISTEIGGDSGIYGTLTLFIGLGAIIGNLSTASISTMRGQGVLYIVMAIASGVTLFFLGLTKSAYMAFFIGLTVGGTQAIFMAINLAFVLRFANDQFRGRVASVNFIFASGAMALGNFLYGNLSEFIPPKLNMLTTGSLFTILVIIMLVFSSGLRSLYQKQENFPTKQQISANV
ncbi:MFS transporter [Bacillus timonensis]|uniref:MFS transporter n=1 Tax=Bacillus timonensis TaxID=1033734 RepID=UPI00028916F1|nr:MFS transporter [Bacillus timonensis]